MSTPNPEPAACVPLLQPNRLQPVTISTGLLGSRACRAGTSDGSGNIAVHYEAGGDELEPTAFFGSDGTFAGTGQTSASLIDQQSGFLTIYGFNPGSQIVAIGPSGSSTDGPYYLNEWDIRPAEDPAGGMVVWFEPGPSGTTASYGVRAFNPDGSLRWTVPFTPPAQSVVALGVDRQGDTLVLFDGRKEYGPGAVIGQWFTAKGELGPSFEVTLPERSPYDLFDRVGDGFFIQAWTGGWEEPLDSRGKQSMWIGSIDGLGTRIQPAPDWLKAHPNTDMHVIHNGTGYVLLPLPTSAETCSQTVGVFTADGESCGSVQFQLEPKACATGNIRIGYDGTVIQDYPDDLDACDHAACDCTWQFWPGYFR